MEKIQDILGDPVPFLDMIFEELEKAGIDVSAYPLDHICYRVENQADYEYKKQMLSQMGEILSESMIGGRPITTFKLKTPIFYKKREIFLLELPSPKPGSKYPEGYEHVEFVVDVPLVEFRDRYNYLSFDEKGFHKEVNSDLRLKWDEYSVKFHEHDLEYVIRFLDI